MKKIITFLIIGILFLNILTVQGAEPHNIQAGTYCLVSLDTGVVLAEKNVSVSITPSEFSKIMTALIASEKLKENDIVTFDEKDIAFYNSYGNIASVKSGESFTVKEHLYNMLLLYSDASANALAKQISGDKEKFVDEMNKKAKELKMNDTFFTTPSGYDPEKKSKISVKDLATLSSKAYENTLLKEIFSTVLFEMGGEKYSSRNHLLSNYTYADFTYSAATGMMVCDRENSCDIVATAERNSSKFLAVITGSPKSTYGRHYFDAINLLEHGFNNFILRTVCRENTILDQIEVKAGSKSSVTLETAENCIAYTPLDYNKDLLTYKIVKKDSITAPVKKGEVIASAIFYYKDTKLAEIPLIASEKVNFRLITPFLSHINTKALLIIVILLVVYFIAKYNSIRKKEVRRKKREKIRNSKD